MSESKQFRDHSITLTKSLSKEARQTQGIFFTPKDARDALFASLPSSFSPSVALEPSFGSGEFLDDLRGRWPSAQLHGVELNQSLYNSYQQRLSTSPNTRITNEDFLSYKGCLRAANLIVGNPPYFVTKEKDPRCMTGRPNIYVAFLYKCVTQHLAPNGILAFILPTSILNSSYYQPMRDYIAKNMTVLACQRLDVKFIDTTQDTLLLTLQNVPADEPLPYMIRIHQAVYLSPHATELTELLRGTSTLSSLGFTVKTGDVVWNQIRRIEGVDVQESKGGCSVQDGNLVADSGAEGAVILYYSHNIGDGRLVTGGKEQEKKKQYITGFGRAPQHAPAILVSRGYGNSYQFKYGMVSKGAFYAENHVNMILPARAGALGAIGRVMKSLSDPRTARFLELFVGNGGLSKTELEFVLPVF